jgi:hypothetical protein
MTLLSVKWPREDIFVPRDSHVVQTRMAVNRLHNKELSASFIRVTRISKLGTTLAVTSD